MKNTIKKSLSLLLACLLVMSISVISVAAEADAIAVTIGTVEAAPGDKVTVPVSIGADSGVVSGNFAIDYDSATLEFVEATDGELNLSSCIVGVTADNVNQIGVAFIGPDMEAVNTEGGILFNLVFNVVENVPTQTSAISFNFEPVRDTDNLGLFDSENKAVEYTTVNGAVSITGSGEYTPATVALGTASGLPGATVEVPLTITADSYVVSGAFTVEYDGDVLDFAGYTDGQLSGISQLSIADTADGKAAVGVIFSTENAKTPITAGGTIATLKFDIAATATAGDTELKFNLVRPDDELTQGGVATADSLDEDATFTKGKITVESNTASTDVTFVVSPEDATITFNGETQTAIEGYATFEGVTLGDKDYTVSAQSYITKTGTVTVVENMDDVTVTLEKAPAVTGTNVTFNVTPADASVTLNGKTITATNGTAVFENVEFGTYTYSVSKDGYVTKSDSVTVALDMAAVTVVLEQSSVTPETAPVPTLTGIRTISDPTYDASTKTITVKALNTESSAGVNVAFTGASAAELTTDKSNGISASASKDGLSKNFVAKLSNGASQSFNVYYGDYTYVVNISFIDDPSLIEFDDILTLRVDDVTYSAKDKTITLKVDNARWKKTASSSGAFIYVADEDVKVSYEYLGNGKMSHSNTAKYTSYETGVNAEATNDGAYGVQVLNIFTWANADSANKIVTNVTLTKGEYSTTYKMVLLLRDISYEGSIADGTDVDVTEILSLRAYDESFVVDNEAKTIYFESSTAYTSAGFAVAVDKSVATLAARPRRQLTAGSGYGLAHGPVDKTQENKYDRYVVARLSKGTEQTYRVKVAGGEDGLAYSWFTVTVKFNRVYDGDIEFAEMLQKNIDSYNFNNETNTIDITYSGDSAAIAPVLISGCKASVSGTYTVTSINDVKGYAVKASDGDSQTIILTLKVGNDTTAYTVNFNHVAK